jgi:glycosidase
MFSCHNATKQIPNQSKVSKTPMPAWAQQATIYEVNTRQYTDAGTFKAFEAHLPRLKELGVDILWFMPIYPIGVKNRKGTLGSYYSIRYYKAVNPEFGTLDDFKSLVNEAHQMGMKVIIDWVANHTSWDHQWLSSNPQWYRKDSLGNIIAPFDWTDVAQLDYSQAGLQNAMKEAMCFWVKETNIDGFRCDVAGMMPVDFWEKVRTTLDSIKPVFMLAEDETETALLNNAFNANYGWAFHHIMNDIAQGKKTATEVADYLKTLNANYPLGAFPLQFTSNHDENSWNGSAIERMGDAAEAFAALSFVVEGCPLIYSGQEAGLNKRLKFFDKDTIDWSDLSASDLYKNLIVLKKENEALWNGTAGGPATIIQTSDSNKIVAFNREKGGNSVTAIFNLTPTPVSISLPDSIEAGYTDYFLKTQNEYSIKHIDLDSWEFKILVRNKLPFLQWWLSSRRLF